MEILTRAHNISKENLDASRTNDAGDELITEEEDSENDLSTNKNEATLLQKTG